MNRSVNSWLSSICTQTELSSSLVLLTWKIETKNIWSEQASREVSCNLVNILNQSAYYYYYYYLLIGNIPGLYGKQKPSRIFTALPCVLNSVLFTSRRYGEDVSCHLKHLACSFTSTLRGLHCSSCIGCLWLASASFICPNQMLASGSWPWLKASFRSGSWFRTNNVCSLYNSD